LHDVVCLTFCYLAGKLFYAPQTCLAICGELNLAETPTQTQTRQRQTEREKKEEKEREGDMKGIQNDDGRDNRGHCIRIEL